MATTRDYGGISAAERRSRRRAALLDAALDLIAEGGPATVTKRAVCARAHLNDRYFYEHFADRDTLLEAVAQEQTADGIAAVVGAVLATEPQLRAQVHAAAEAALDFLTADPRRKALLLGSHTTEAVNRARLTTQRTIADAMAAMTRELLPDNAALPVDTDMAAYTIVSGTLELVAAWIRGEFTATREYLTTVIAGMLLTPVELAGRSQGGASEIDRT